MKKKVYVKNVEKKLNGEKLLIAKFIKMEKEKQTNEWEDKDGWSKTFFDEFIEAQDIINDVGYEIRNCRRDRSLKDMKEELDEATQKLKSFIADIEDVVEDVNTTIGGTA